MSCYVLVKLHPSAKLLQTEYAPSHQSASNTLKGKMLFWQNCRHRLHWKLSKRQLPVQPMTKISSKWRHFRFRVCWLLTSCSHCPIYHVSWRIYPGTTMYGWDSYGCQDVAGFYKYIHIYIYIERERERETALTRHRLSPESNGRNFHYSDVLMS